MLDAVYIDLIASRSIVGWLPKPAFYSLFESLRQKPDSKVIVFNPEESGEPGPEDQKENAPKQSGREMVGLVETGEGRTPPPCTDSSLERNLSYLNKLFAIGYPNASKLYLEDDPTQLLPHLLDHLVVLGQLAQQLNLTLGGNGHRPDKLREVVLQLTNKEGKAGNE